MRAVLLVAGRGSRLRNLTNSKPKCLVSFMGKPLLERAINTLIEGGCTTFTFITGYKSEEIERFINQRDLNAEIIVNENWQNTNMVHSLLEATHRLEKEPCIISYGDIFFSNSLVKKLVNNNSDISIAYDKNGRLLWEERFQNPLEDIENFTINSLNNLTSIGGTVTDISVVEGQYMGLLKLNPLGFNKLRNTLLQTHPELQKNIDITSLLSSMIKENIEINCVENSENWGEIDSPEDLKFFEKKLNYK